MLCKLKPIKKFGKKCQDFISKKKREFSENFLAVTVEEIPI